MLRPKSAGGSRSFLDDLLGNDSDLQDSSTAAQRQRKSVRFFDQNEEDNSPAVRSRPHSSTLDSLLNPSRSETTASTSRPSSDTVPVTSKSKSDWLGLATDEEHVGSKGAGEGSAQKAATPLPTASTADWITAGLRARQSKAPEPDSRPAFLHSDASKAPSTSEPRPWQPKIMESTTPRTKDSTQAEPAILAAERAGKDEPQVVAKRADASAEPVSGAQMVPAQAKLDVSLQMPVTLAPGAEQEEQLAPSSQSAVYLQTKLRIVTMEKTFLEQTVEQMKNNHQEELKAMVSLYEQQMRMTSEMYKRHEEMIQEERDRRITELRGQLDRSELEMRDMRLKSEQRLATLENEWQADVQRIRLSNEQASQHLVQLHEEQVHRLEQRLATDNEHSLQTSTDLLTRHSKSVADMLARWESSAVKIEQLQRSVVARQEDLIHTRIADSEEIAGGKFGDIEQQWKAFVADLQQHRTEIEHLIQGELDRSHSEERRKIDEERAHVEGERQELQTLRSAFSTEVSDWRQRETDTAEKCRIERDKLRQDVVLFEERRSLLETLYSERKRTIDEEQERLNKQNEELSSRRSHLEQEERQLQQRTLSLQAEQQEHAAKKELFSQEKDQLADMGLALAKRAEELEKLSEVALKEKLDGIQAMDDMDSMQSEVDHKLASVEEAMTQLRRQQQKLSLERAQLDQQWAVLKELKETIVCNLCGSALNRVPTKQSKYSFAMFSQRSNGGFAPPASNQSGPLFYGLFNNLARGNMSLPNDMTAYMVRNESGQINSDPEQDQNLFFWQMSAQQDAASLAEETKFVDTLKKSRESMKM